MPHALSAASDTVFGSTAPAALRQSGVGLLAFELTVAMWRQSFAIVARHPWNAGTMRICVKLGVSVVPPKRLHIAAAAVLVFTPLQLASGQTPPSQPAPAQSAPAPAPAAGQTAPPAAPPPAQPKVT